VALPVLIRSSSTRQRATSEFGKEVPRNKLERMRSRDRATLRVFRCTVLETTLQEEALALSFRKDLQSHDSGSSLARSGRSLARRLASSPM
jgi:hypothetical protein